MVRLDGWTVGAVTAVGVGVGAALAASIGSIGYLVGLAACLGIFTLVREIQRRRLP